MTTLEKLGLMTWSEASERWGFNKTYLKDKNNSKGSSIFLEDTTCKVGNEKAINLITREGMEYITGMTEEEAKQRKKEKEDEQRE